MDDFFSKTTRDLQEGNMAIQDCSNSIGVLREKCCDLELSLTALHDPDSRIKLQTLRTVSKAAVGDMSRKHVSEENITPKCDTQ